MKARARIWVFYATAAAAGALAGAWASDALAAQQICWDNPTQNTDGTEINDLASVTLHYSDDPNIADGGSIVGVHETETTIPGDSVCAIMDLPEGDWYFVATAVDEDGNRSDYSNEVMKTFDVPPESATIALEPLCDGCTKRTAMLVVMQTGETVTLRWETEEVADNVEVEVLEYPPEDGQVPFARGEFSGTTSTYDWQPSRSALYYSRVRTCTDEVCSAWSNSYEQGYIYYAELAPAEPGGIN